MQAPKPDLAAASKSAPCIADHIIFDLQCSMQRPSLFLMQAPKPVLAAASIWILSIWILESIQLLQLPAPAFLLKHSLAQWVVTCRFRQRHLMLSSFVLLSDSHFDAVQQISAEAIVAYSSSTLCVEMQQVCS